MDLDTSDLYDFVKKTIMYPIRLTQEEAEKLETLAHNSGYKAIAPFIRETILGKNQVIDIIKSPYEEIRGERRSFFCSNKLWYTLQVHIDGKTSSSKFIRDAIMTKMVEDKPKLKEYYSELV